MSIIEMLGQSAILSVLGMVVVFIFLIILVIIISQIGRLVNTEDSNKRLIIPDAQSNKFTHTSDIKQEKTGEKNPQIAAVIMAAISEYRKSH